jgi:hypothetical protein
MTDGFYATVKDDNFSNNTDDSKLNSKLVTDKTTLREGLHNE